MNIKDFNFENMTDEEIIRKVFSKYYTLIGVINLLSGLTFLASPIFWLWISFDIFLKVCLTSLFVYIFSVIIYHISMWMCKQGLKSARKNTFIDSKKIMEDFRKKVQNNKIC